MREVELLSSTSSSNNVVRYFGAWVEQGLANDFGLDSADDSDSEGAFSSSSGFEMTKSGNDEGVRKEAVCTCDRCKSEYVDWEISFEKWGLLEVRHPELRSIWSLS